ncbi:Ras-related protein RABH1b [Zea mays]|uniref:Ras-related protein RABH1b n=1 Tax=Zea mays TaxID=4577 RepID=A0A1D6J0I6_MAIZE|nr:Ras-related protein RABH1b [Zea mays]AQK41587.1 Ras-related protein RABH1b [Zea mays]
MEGDPACGLALADEEAECSSWDSDDEYQKFIQNMNPPRVTIDNTSCPSAIVIHVSPSKIRCFLIGVFSLFVPKVEASIVFV